MSETTTTTPARTFPVRYDIASEALALDLSGFRGLPSPANKPPVMYPGATYDAAAEAAALLNPFADIESADWDQTPIGTGNVSCENI